MVPELPFFPRGTSPSGISAEKFRRLSSRLTAKIDRSEQGQLLPLTSAALQLDNPETRLRQLVNAIATERLIVPITIEDHSENVEEHRMQDRSEPEQVPLVVGRHPQRGQAILAFTSVEQLAAWEREARPMPMSAVKVAMTAVATGIPRIWINPKGAGVWIPRPAVEALASGGKWIPAWDDQELADELLALAKTTSPIEVKLTLVPAVNSQTWAGGLRVQIGFSSSALNAITLDSGEQRQIVTQVLAAVAQSERLQVAAEDVEFLPQLF